MHTHTCTCDRHRTDDKTDTVIRIETKKKLDIYWHHRGSFFLPSMWYRFYNANAIFTIPIFSFIFLFMFITYQPCYLLGIQKNYSEKLIEDWSFSYNKHTINRWKILAIVLVYLFSFFLNIGLKCVHWKSNIFSEWMKIEYSRFLMIVSTLGAANSKKYIWYFCIKQKNNSSGQSTCIYSFIRIESISNVQLNVMNMSELV